MAYLAIGEIDQSHKAFLAAIESDPKNHRAWYNLGIVLKSLQKLSRAKDAFEHCLTLDPTFIPAGRNLIHLSLDMGDYPKAEKALEEMKKNSTDTPDLRQLDEIIGKYRKPPGA